MVGAGAVELAGAKLKHLGVFVEVLRDRQRFMKLDQISVDNTNVDVDLYRGE